ncbi:hypothetical protein AVEN_83478-1 [Araneus ventricosus]|uniref:Uncharacterized protein n=1 Tax=Araneus ventricosus TaxID=182803 RepID=A0A4Y2I1W8_ARAVE|nr:hypothetical protein AVEN_83478-1 [Araneus ventricosus]
MPIQVPYHPFNFRMAAAIFIRVVSRHGKVPVRYCVKPLTAPAGGKRWRIDLGCRLGLKDFWSSTPSRLLGRVEFDVISCVIASQAVPLPSWDLNLVSHCSITVLLDHCRKAEHGHMVYKS